MFYHPRNGISGGQRLFSVQYQKSEQELNEIYKKLGLIYPDFIYFDEKFNTYIIADSKYKKN